MEIEYSPNFQMRYYFYQMSSLHRTSTLYFRYLVWPKGTFLCIFLCNVVLSHRSIMSLLNSELKFGWWRQVAQWSSWVQRTMEVSATMQVIIYQHDTVTFQVYFSAGLLNLVLRLYMNYNWLTAHNSCFMAFAFNDSSAYCKCTFLAVHF